MTTNTTANTTATSDTSTTAKSATTEFDWFALQEQAHREFGARVAQVDDWTAATPDKEWTVGDLVRHVVQEQQWIPPLLAGLSIEQAKRRVEPLGDDLAAEWATHSARATAAWQAAPADAAVQLSYDTVTVLDYLREQVSDVTIHSWDLARATAADEELDDLLIEAVWTVFEPQRDALEASGLFDSPVPMPEDAPLQSRLLALTGRDDRR
ncbi:TIGR03086 family metal-binding protein [Cryobacterium sp. SO2]|uniref:TIGR03086 family metal-binding protein n=1 Tax=Cryobacterium sp. SO2 TaxID=1897060 RepID=UPI00223E60CF|nr:TIGR03086 family metal-binding protein [Cryobacterium sp. SO2]WEO75870.1 TIGR03086 family metal-binding protein [Cryobacterium sp. SO2]